MSKRAMNFSAGPACLPLEVLEEAQAELLDFAGTGKSVLETSHRSPEYDAVHTGAQQGFKDLLGLGDAHHVLFFGGGATTQFALVPMNLLAKGKTADYVMTGAWSKKAIEEARHFGTVNVAASAEVDGKCARIPTQDELSLTEGAAYLHITSNNTIFGTQYKTFPQTKSPLVADMSSDFLSRRFDAKRFSLIYAGAQKNLGPAGVTVVIVDQATLDRCPADLPVMFNYPKQAKAGSLLNTPPAFAIYILDKTLKWLAAKGGVEAIEKENERKGARIYGAIDANPEFFRAPVETQSRSLMNVVFNLPTEALEKKFITEAKAADMIGIKGHRSVGGIRFSTYNAVPYEWVDAAASLMEEFVRKNG